MKETANSERLALVFGCSLYDEFRELANPVKDAEAVKNKLKSFGFRVEYAKNPNRNKMIEKLGVLLDNLNEDTSDIVIYFAGHGCNIGECLLGLNALMT